MCAIISTLDYKTLLNTNHTKGQKICEKDSLRTKNGLQIWGLHIQALGYNGTHTV